MVDNIVGCNTLTVDGMTVHSVDINADMVIIVAGENVGAGIDSWLEETL